MKPVLTVIAVAAVAALLGSSVAAAQEGPDATTRIRRAMPAPQAERVLAVIANARAAGLPGGALEQIALLGVARAAAPDHILQAVERSAADFAAARAALARAGRSPAPDEVEAGGEALGRGVDGAAVSELARSAPSGRSLAVPLFVLGSLVDRGLPSDDAIAAVLERLQARASDRELEGLPGQAGRLIAQGHRPGDVARLLRDTRPVPQNPGRPETRGRPTGRGRP